MSIIRPIIRPIISPIIGSDIDLNILEALPFTDAYWTKNWGTAVDQGGGVFRFTSFASGSAQRPGISRANVTELTTGIVGLVEAEVKRVNHDFISVNFSGVTTSIGKRAAVNLSTLETYLGSGDMQITVTELSGGWIRIRTRDSNLSNLEVLRRPNVRLVSVLTSQEIPAPAGTEAIDIRRLAVWVE